MNWRLVGTVLVAIVLVCAGTAGALSRPPPDRVCAGCVSGIGSAADNVEVTDSVTRVYLQETGDARVEARLDVSGYGVDELRQNATLRGEVREGINRYDNTVLPRENLTVGMDGDTLVVSFRYVDVTERRYGVTFSDRLVRPSRPDSSVRGISYEVETDRLVVHGPNGTTPLVAPPPARVVDGRLVWEDEGVSPRTYLVFGNDAGSTAGHALVTAVVLRWATPVAALGWMTMTSLLLAVAWLFMTYYPARMEADGNWSLRADPLFWTFACVEVAVVTVLVAWVVAGALVALGGVLASGGFVGLLYLKFTPDNGARYREPPAPDGGSNAHETPADRKDVPVPAFGDRDALGPHLRPAVTILLATLLLTVLLAADYMASSAELAFFFFLLVAVLAFAGLARAVRSPTRGHYRTAAVVTLAASTWLIAFSATLADGVSGATVPEFVATSVFVTLVGVPVFYWRL